MQSVWYFRFIDNHYCNVYICNSLTYEYVFFLGQKFIGLIWRKKRLEVPTGSLKPWMGRHPGATHTWPLLPYRCHRWYGNWLIAQDMRLLENFSLLIPYNMFEYNMCAISIPRDMACALHTTLNNFRVILSNVFVFLSSACFCNDTEWNDLYWLCKSCLYINMIEST